MTTCNNLTALIALIAVGIAYFQLKTNQDKLRLDLYNKRFEIYTKTIDLYLELPNSTSIENMSKEDIDALETFKILKNSFIKYYRESQFLFKEDSGIHSILREILDKLNLIIFDKEHRKSFQDADVEFKIEQQNKVITARNLIESDILKLEEAMKPYLNFHNKVI